MTLISIISLLTISMSQVICHNNTDNFVEINKKEKIVLCSSEEKTFEPHRDYNYPIDLPTTDWNLVQCNLSESYSWDLTFLNITNLQTYLGVNYPIINPIGDLQNWHNLQSDYPSGIFGTDDRTLIENNYSWPYMPTGKLTISHCLFDGDDYHNQYYSGTAFMVAPNLALTAAHCVFGEVTNNNTLESEIKFANSLFFMSGNNSSYYDGCYAQSVIISRNYFLSDFSSYDAEYDWALLILNSDFGYKTGWYDIKTDFSILGSDVFSYGYPVDFNGDMCYTFGSLIGYTGANNDAVYKTTMDIQGGQSGAPILINYNGIKTVIGVHTFHSGNDFSGGPIIPPIVKALIIIYSNYRTTYSLNLINPSEYGFEEAYPTDEYTSNNYSNSYSSITFATKRYRTGYIQSQYIVLSSIRNGINDAFLEYHMPFSLNMIQIDLSHWRDVQYDLLNNSNGTAYLQIKNSNDEWVTYLDLLSTNTNLPRDRSKPKPYVIRYSGTFTDFRIIVHYNLTFNGNTNRGRICVGNIYAFAF